MNRKIRMFLIAVLFSLSILISGSAIVNMNNSMANAANVWSEVTFEESYLQGDTLNVPDRTLTVDGKDAVVASATVTMPDGTTTTNQTVQLTLAGKYTIKYTAMVGGRVYSRVEEIMANYAMVTYQDPATSVEYGAHKLAPTVDGLVVRLAANDKLMFNEVIDVTSVTADDVLFEAFVTADSVGTLDFEKIFVQFTDVEDPENYFKVRYIHTHSSTGGPNTYILAGGNGQPMSGWEGGSWNVIHVEDQWGACVKHSFMSDYGGNTTDMGKVRLSLRFDAASLAVYHNQTMIIDFDNPKHFGNALWSGFKSGKVQMSVWADDYKANSANFVITKMAGIDLTSNTMAETDPPEITVDTEYAVDAMPDAKVGMQYPVPTATAFDEYSGECAVKTSVYYNYGTAAASNAAIVDGKFMADYMGTYAIVYESEDRMGNVAQKVYWVAAKTDVTSPKVVPSETIPAEINAGEWFTLPAGKVTGGSGANQVKIYVDGEEVTDAIRLHEVKTYAIKYEVVDYIGQTDVYETQVKVNGGSAPIFIEEPIFPKYLIAGAYYNIPDLYANDYTSGELVKRLATVTVKDANGTKTVASGEQYVPEVVNNLDLVEITYSVDGVTKTLELPTVKAKDESGVYVGNYFDLKGATLTLNNEMGVIQATEANGSWTFANALVAHNVLLSLNTNPEKSNYDGIRITFTDSVDSSIAITADLLKAGKNCQFITDVKVFDIEVGFTSQSASTYFEIGYADGLFFLNGSSVGVKNTVEGKPFEGFPSGKIYVNFAFINATAGEAAYSMVEVNGQKINTTTLDRVAPKIVIVGVRGGTFEHGSTITIPSALAGDTLDPNVTFSVTIKDPSNKVIKDTSGLLLENVDPHKEYQIKLDAYGQFKVNYTATDSFSGRKANLVYAINVDDNKGPTIIFDHAFQATAKVGDTLIIPDFQVTDNVCGASEIGVMKSCLAPNGEVVEFYENSNAILATKAGVYQLRVFAIDKSGNQTLCRVDIVVTD